MGARYRGWCVTETHAKETNKKKMENQTFEHVFFWILNWRILSADTCNANQQINALMVDGVWFLFFPTLYINSAYFFSTFSAPHHSTPIIITIITLNVRCFVIRYLASNPLAVLCIFKERSKLFGLLRRMDNFLFHIFCARPPSMLFIVA